MAREHLADTPSPAGKSWHEFAGPDAKLYLCDETGVVETLAMADILPLGFEGDTLK